MWDLTPVFVFLIFTVGNANSSPKGRNGKHYVTLNSVLKLKLKSKFK